MKEKFKIERKAMRVLPADDPEQEYLSRERQLQYHVTCSNNHLFRNAEASLLDGSYNFALLCEDEPFLLCDRTLHHSYLANGKKVFATGSLTFDQGKLVEITNNSGHYMPTDEETLAVIKALYRASGGTLKRYVSYCANVPKIYLVEDLLNINDFSSIQPFNEIKEKNSITMKLSEYEQSDSSKSSSYLDDECILMESESIPPAFHVYEEKIVGATDVTKSASQYIDDELLSIPAQLEDAIKPNVPVAKSLLKTQRRYGKDLNEQCIAKYLGIVGRNNFFKKEINLKEESSVFNKTFDSV
ncbi:hypothetical protein [Legionella wadsworthii]|uniref:hypothetical protein n=1 Tax=Legionella wadsworthii TaxID=28088 RepID=UPI00105425E5|nr:hypothetical protein [Legionella wadsworthii]